MKLLVVTGTANSNWSHIAHALHTPFQKVSEHVFSKVEKTNESLLKKRSSNAAIINEVLDSLEDDTPSILVNAEILPALKYWAKSPEIQFLVLFCAPQIALANALQNHPLTHDECTDLLLLWQEETKAAFNFYQQNKTHCLLFDVQDVVENQKKAAKDISILLAHETQLKADSLNIIPEAKLAADLFMIEQDEAFELYDEIRSAAPLYGALELSGIEDLSSFANDALSIVCNKYAEQQDKQKYISTLNNSLEESLAKVVQQQKKHEDEKNSLEEKIKELNLVNSEYHEKLSSLEQLHVKTHQALEDALKNQTKLTKQHETRAVELETLVSEAKAEQELLLLQIGQLQEELEDSHSAGIARQDKHKEQVAELQQKLEQQQQQVKEQQLQHVKLAEAESQKIEKVLAENVALSSEIKQNQSEQELLLLQIGQLQEELEVSHSADIARHDKHKEQVAELQLKLEQQQQQAKEQQIQHVKLAEAESQKIEKVLAENVALSSEIKQNQSEQELHLLQVAQLQEELESLYQANQTLNSQHKKHSADLAEHQQNAINIHSLAAENELAVLQINQLQEELEFYYLQLQEKDANKMQDTHTIARLTQDVFAKCWISSFEIVGGYETEGYSDIQLILHDVMLADGRQFKSLKIKLTEVDGRPGLEFRPSESEDTNPPLRWREDMQDEHGAFIKYIPNPTKHQANLQQKIDESLSASERLFILSIADALADTLQQTHPTTGDLQDGKLRDWKLVALRLQLQVSQLPEWLSFDAITLIEEMRSDNYEHLWINFDNLLVNNHFYPNFKLKFAAVGPLNEQSLFTDTLMLELREQENNGAPLQAWPPVAQDEYGFKLQANIDLLDDELKINVDEKMSAHDKQFLRHLAKNLVNFIYALKQQNIVFERNIEDWLSVANRVNQMGQSKTKDIEDVDVQILPNLNLDFQEHVDLGGYQHLLYKTVLSDGQNLMIKVRAENINPSSQLADISIELRTGEASVPLSETMFFSEDDYGPRVLIGLSDLETDSFTEFELTEGGKIVKTFMATINQLIESNPAIDIEQQALWIGLLTKEQ